MSDVRKGDKIEYAYTLTGRNPIFNNHYFGDIYFQWAEHIAHLYRSVLVSAQRPLYFKAFNKAPQVAISNKKGLKCYEWESFQVEPASSYEGQTGWYNEFAYVQVTDYRNWQEVVDWGLKINPVATTIKGPLARQIADLKAAAGGDKEKYFRSAVKMVQDEVRYMGIEMGEYSHRANTPERVYNQRYGDCKDKALLLATILNAEGIEAHLALINTSFGSKLDDFLPSPGLFDHAVCVANVNGKEVWADATIAYQRGTGTNLYFPQYGKALVLKPGNGSPSVISPAKTGKTMYQEYYTIANEKDMVKLEVKSTYTLNAADRMRDRLASSSLAETEKSYLEYYAKIYPLIKVADSVTVLDDEANNRLTTIEHYLIPGFFKKDSVDEKYLAYFYANYINEQLINISNRTHVPIALNYPCNIDYTINLILKTGWNIEKRRKKLNRDAYTFSSAIKVNGDTLALNYKFSYLQSYVPVNKLDEYRSDVKHIADDMLSYSFSYTPDTSKIPFRANYWMVAFVSLLFISLAALAVWIYRTPTNEVLFAPGAGFTPLGGWLYVVAFGLFITPLAVMVSVFQAGYFDMHTWNMHLPGHSSLSIHAVLLFEISGNVVIMCYAIFCLVLLLNRRDILPRYITGLYVLAVVYAIADYAAAHIINNGAVSDKAAFAIIRAIIASAVWIPYFRLSGRVEQTFIVPYPAGNYSYEELQPPELTLQPSTAEQG